MFPNFLSHLPMELLSKVFVNRSKPSQATNKSGHINQLPVEILAQIFLHLPLECLMSLELVCHRWQSVQEYALSTITSLTLHHRFLQMNYPGYFRLSFFEPLAFSPPDFGQNSLVCNAIYEKTSRFLVRKLPNITKLAIFGCDQEHQGIMVMLEAWNCRLSSLAFCPSNFTAWPLFWSHLNAASTLKHLVMHEVSDEFDLTILPQLETFYLDENHNHCRTMLETFLDGLGDNIRSFGLTGHWTELNLFGNLSRLRNYFEHSISSEKKQVLNSKVVHLTLQHCNLKYDHGGLAFLTSQFNSVTHLDLTIFYLRTASQVFIALQDLAHLTSLRLSCDNRQSHFYFDVNQPVSILPLVKVLHLSIANAPILHDDLPNFYRKVLLVTLPSLEILRFENEAQLYKCACHKKFVNTRAGQVASELGRRLCVRSSQCTCPDVVYHTLVHHLPRLHRVYRNNTCVYNRAMHHHNKADFMQRLVNFGLSKYCPNCDDS